MRASLSYIPGYGWHCGRLLLWPALLLYSLFGTIPWLAAQALASVLIPFHWPIGLLGPALFGLWGWSRVRRKLRGEPFVWNRFWDDDSDVDVIHRHHDERRWRSLLRMEVVAWGGGLLIQLTTLLIAWTAWLMR